MTDDDGPTWTAQYYRRCALGTERWYSLIDAVRFLVVSEESGSLAPNAIIGPDGTELYRFGYQDGQVRIEDLYERLSAEEIAAEADEEGRKP